MAEIGISLVNFRKKQQELVILHRLLNRAVAKRLRKNMRRLEIAHGQN